MGFWHSVYEFFWRDESTLVLAMALLPAALLYYFHSKDGSRSLLHTLGLFFVCEAGLFLSGLLHAVEFERGATIMYEVFILGGGVALIRLWGLVIFRLLLPSLRLSLPRITEDIFVILAYVGWGMVRLRYAGLDLSGIVATSAMITAVVAFAMQDTLGNILGGLAIQLDNSIKVGDWIKVDDVAGRVVDIRWRSTLVETRNWETVVFPNSQLMKSKFMVLGRRTDQPVQWRRWVWFNVGLDVPPAKVGRVVEDAVRQADIPNVASEPKPNCVLMDFDEKGYARYALRYWLTDLLMDDPTDALMRWHIMAALQRAGVRLALEEHNIHLTKENEKYEEQLHQREIQLRIKTLHKVELFSRMTEEELSALAGRLRFSPFARGEIISKQGTTAHWLYVIIRGEAEVYLEQPGGGKRVLRELGKGSFFGEMGLMTGATRTATVVAKTDMECYRLDKEVFEDILRQRPSIAEEMSQVLAMRQAELEVARNEVDADSARSRIPHHRGEILVTIRNFFGLNS